MKNSSLLSLNTYLSDEAASSSGSDEKTDKKRQSSCVSKSLLDVKKRGSSTTFSFSLISYLREPAEAAHLSDYELEQTDSVFSCSEVEEKRDSNNLLPNLIEPDKVMTELKKTHSLPSSSAEGSKDSANNLKPNFKKSVEKTDLSLSMDQARSLPSSPAKFKKKVDNMVSSNTKKAIEVICLSDTDQEQADSSSNRPAKMKKQNDTSTCHSLIPYFKAASFLPELRSKNDSPSKHKHGLDENLSKTKFGEDIRSKYGSTSVNAKKKTSRKEHLENYGEIASLSKFSLNKNKKSLVSSEYLNISDCEESLEEGQCTTDDDFSQTTKESSFVKFPQAYNIQVSSIPLPSKDPPTYLNTNSLTKEDCSTPILKRSRFNTKEDASTPSIKKCHSISKEDLSTPKKKKKSSLITEHESGQDKRNDYVNLSNLDFSSLSIPPPPPPSEVLSTPISFYKMYPPPSLKRSHSMTEEDSANNNEFVCRRSTDHLKSFNFASSNSPIIKARRSLPSKIVEGYNSAFHSSTHPCEHSSSSLSSGTPKRKFHDSSRRHSDYDKNSRQYSYRSCSTDQTPYSPADSYRRHKRFKSELPYYNVEDLSTFQSDDGFIDSHCHLDFLFQRMPYDGSFGDFQKDNKDTFPLCFKGCVAVFCNPKTFQKKYVWEEFLEENNVWASFGCHPHNARDFNDEIEQSLLKALDHHKVRALGEIGLDYSNRNNCPKDIQRKVFMRQLKIALEKKLPLVIHCRDAHDDGLDIMKKMVPKNYYIHLHCFTDTWDVACEWLDEFPNLYIGLTNVITFPSATEVHEVAKKISLNRLLLETDAPYFVPRPLARQQSNLLYSHPGMAIHVAAQVAALKGGIPLELVLHKTRQNTQALYKI